MCEMSKPRMRQASSKSTNAVHALNSLLRPPHRRTFATSEAQCLAHSQTLVEGLDDWKPGVFPATKRLDTRQHAVTDLHKRTSSSTAPLVFSEPLHAAGTARTVIDGLRHRDQPRIAPSAAPAQAKGCCSSELAKLLTRSMPEQRAYAPALTLQQPLMALCGQRPVSRPSSGYRANLDTRRIAATLH